MSYHIPGLMCAGVMVWFSWVVWYLMQAEALLVCLCEMWGLGVNGHLEQWFCFSWALLRNEFAFVVEGLDIVLFARQE